MTWTSLFAFLIPYALWRIWEEEAYYNFYGSLKGDNPLSELWAPAETEYWNTTVTNWQKIVWIQGAIYGPIFLFGLFALSDVLGAVFSLYLEHIISNFFIAGSLGGLYFLYVIATFDGWKTDYNRVKFVAWLIANIYLNIGVGIFGAEAMNYTREIVNYDEEFLWPVVFYFLRWLSHNDRDECAQWDLQE